MAYRYRRRMRRGFRRLSLRTGSRRLYRRRR